MNRIEKWAAKYNDKDNRLLIIINIIIAFIFQFRAINLSFNLEADGLPINHAAGSWAGEYISFLTVWTRDADTDWFLLDPTNEDNRISKNRIL